VCAVQLLTDFVALGIGGYNAPRWLRWWLVFSLP
jgi:hypothetical protein